MQNALADACGHVGIHLVTLARAAEEEAGAFGQKLREAQLDIVGDSFPSASERHLTEKLRGQI
jgi:hypothetical protein